MSDDVTPYRRRPVHMAAKVRSDGGVSPLCAVRPRSIDVRRATWTLQPDAVTCPRCLARLPAKNAEPRP
jgi:hypothetical protein